MKQTLLIGPMVWLTAALCAVWVGVGVASFLMLSAPSGFIFAGVCLAGTTATAWLAVSMVVRHGPFGGHLPGHGEVLWGDIASIELQPGVISVPAVSVRHGRALSEVELGGLAWFGRRTSQRLAQRLADAGDLGEVVERGKSAAPGRRAAD